MTTNISDEVLSKLAPYDLHNEHGNNYRCNSPLRAGADGKSFTLRIDGPMEGAWYDHRDATGGSLLSLAEKLGIEIPKRIDVKSSRIKYKDLAEYAAFKGVPVEDFIMAGWEPQLSKWKNRPGLKYQTRTGVRIRFTDGENPKFSSQTGYTACWYGLDRAIGLAKKYNRKLVIANGEPSVIVAQHFEIPACCITGGESKNVPPILISELMQKWQGEIIIALDCDEAGLKGARKYVEALKGKAVAVDLNFSKGGDLADLCKLHDVAAYDVVASSPALFENEPVEITKAAPRYVSSADMHRSYQAAITGEAESSLKPFESPFMLLHRYNGFGHYCIPGKLAYLASFSGGTKTIGIETAIAVLRERGIHCIVYTPEWVDGYDSIEMAAREVQRVGGMTLEKTLELLFWQSQKESARPVTIDTIALASARSKYLAELPGQVFYLTGKGLSVEQICEDVDYCCQAETLKGNKPSVVFIDFAQLMWLEDDKKKQIWMEAAIGLLKDCCGRNGLFGFVSSQMNKNPAQRVKSGKEIDASMMQWLSDQQANIVFGFMPVVNKHGNRVFAKDSEGNTLGINRGKVLKNSLAPLIDEYIYFGVAFDLLSWTDEIAEDQVKQLVRQSEMEHA